MSSENYKKNLCMCKYITKARIKVSFAYFLRFSYINVHVHKFRFNTVDNKKKNHFV